MRRDVLKLDSADASSTGFPLGGLTLTNKPIRTHRTCLKDVIITAGLERTGLLSLCHLLCFEMNANKWESKVNVHRDILHAGMLC